MIQLLKDQTLQETLAKDGVIKVPFFESGDIEQLRNLYKTENPGQEPPGMINGIHMTTWCSDPVYKNRVKEGLEKIFNEACRRIFQQYRSLNHVFIVKRPGKDTTFDIHQDWSVVDEAIYPSLNIWAPLYDVNESNGALWILKGSHHIKQNIRGAGILFPDYRFLYDKLKDKVHPIAVKAGEALVFYHSTMHGSPPNRSDALRIVAVNSIVPENAPLRIYFQRDSESPIELVEPDDDFIYHYKNLREDSAKFRPKGKLINTILQLDNEIQIEGITELIG